MSLNYQTHYLDFGWNLSECIYVWALWQRTSIPSEFARIAACILFEKLKFDAMAWSLIQLYSSWGPGQDLKTRYSGLLSLVCLLWFDFLHLIADCHRNFLEIGCPYSLKTCALLGYHQQLKTLRVIATIAIEAWFGSTNLQILEKHHL